MDQNKKITAVITFMLLSLFWAAHVCAETVQRSNYIVKNLTCTSCLATIEAELKGIAGALGMDADLRQGRVTVDHLSSLDNELIAATITRLGYPATMDWTATVPEQRAKKFSRQGSKRSGCSSGCCSVPGGAGSGPTAWKAAPATGTISRTTMQVRNLTCTSCLANIAAELRKLSSTFGMNGYLSRGIVMVDHADASENNMIADVISGLGYPARVVATNEIPVQKTFQANPGPGSDGKTVRTGRGCNSKGPCNATSASWQKLYNRYFSQTDKK
ncbi:MAG: heavy metal-associated domain-containing protein [Desulfobulbales bacterium]|nr:heavy metal-associated domain-containing protein [Desulfobulbales bacterium]